MTLKVTNNQYDRLF